LNIRDKKMCFILNYIVGEALYVVGGGANADHIICLLLCSSLFLFSACSIYCYTNKLCWMPLVRNLKKMGMNYEIAKGSIDIVWVRAEG